MHYSPVVQRF